MATPAHSLVRRTIRALRLKHELTQEALAERAGLDYKHYQLLELGQTEMASLPTLEKLARVFGVKAWVLLCDEPGLIAKRTGLSLAALRTHSTQKPGRPRKAKK